MVTQRESLIMSDETTTSAAATEGATTTTTQADSKTETKFTQADIDKIAGNRAKEAAASARKALLKELGFDPEDAKAVDTLKGNLTAFKQAEDAKKTAEDKALERIAALEKERDEAKEAAVKLQTARRTDRLNGQLERLASAAKAQVPSDVVEYLNKHHADDVTKLLSDDDTFDEKAAAALMEAVKKARAHWFGITGMGTMSLREGRTIDVGKQDQQRGVISTQRAIRKGF